MIHLNNHPVFTDTAAPVNTCNGNFLKWFVCNVAAHLKLHH